MNPIKEFGDILERQPMLAYPFGKLRRGVKGQTALEYLLIVVVALIVVVLVFVLMKQTATGAKENASVATGNISRVLGGGQW